MPGSECPKLVVSTRNQHKLREIHAIMTDLDLELVGLDAFPHAPEVVEDRDTLEENASKKAEELFAYTSTATMADDTGLEVLALGGAPGVHSARYAGKDSDDAANRRFLLENLKGVDDRRAQFRTVIALALNSGTYHFEGTCRGRITEEERGDGGFGYDCIFVPDGYERTFAELSAEEKNSISHRGRALERFAGYLAALLEQRNEGEPNE